MTYIEEQRIIENYKFYMQEILQELKEYNERIEQQEKNSRYFKNPLGFHGILFYNADYYHKDLALNLRKVLENLAFAIMEANVEGYKEKDKHEKANSKLKYENVEGNAKNIIEKVLHFNYQCLPVAIKQEKQSPIITPLSNIRTEVSEIINMSKDDFYVFYDVLSEGDKYNRNRIHAKNKNNKTTLYDKIFKKDKKNYMMTI